MVRGCHSTIALWYCIGLLWLGKIRENHIANSQAQDILVFWNQSVQLDGLESFAVEFGDMMPEFSLVPPANALTQQKIVSSTSAHQLFPIQPIACGRFVQEANLLF